MTEVSDLFTIQEAADYIGVNRAAIRRMNKNGRLTPVVVGYVTLYLRKDLERIKGTFFAEGMTHTDIANMYGVGRGTVAHFFKRLNVKPIGRNNHRRGGAIYDPATVQKFAQLLGWESLPQNPTSEPLSPQNAELEYR